MINVHCEQFWYWLGFLFADGCLYQNVRGYYYIRLCLSLRDKKHLEQFADFVGYKVNIIDYYKDGRESQVLVNIGKQDICKLFIQYGLIQHKSHRISLPSIPKKYLHHFIRGYFDGDGHIGWSKSLPPQLRFTLTSRSKNILCQIARHLKQYTHSSLKVRKCKGAYRIEVMGNRVCPPIYEYLYSDATIYLERKYQIFAKNRRVDAESLV